MSSWSPHSPALEFRPTGDSELEFEFNVVAPPILSDNHRPCFTSNPQKLSFSIEFDRRLSWQVSLSGGGRRLIRETKVELRTRTFPAAPTLFRHRSRLIRTISAMLSVVGMRRDMQETPAQDLADYAIHVITNSSDSPHTISVQAKFVVRDTCVIDASDYLRAMADRFVGEIELRQSSDGGGDGIVPASAAAIQQLQTITYGGGDSSTTTTTCTICMEDFQPGSLVTRMPCAHSFHGNCITTWLGKSHFCPICRHELPVQEASS